MQGHGMPGHNVDDRFNSMKYMNTSEHICIPFDRGMFTPKGIFNGDKLLDSIFSVFMFQVITAFFVSRVVYFLLRPLKQHKFVCNVLSGIILGPSVLGRNKKFLNTIFPQKELVVFNTSAAIGAITVIFIIAVKTDGKMMYHRAKKAWSIVLLSLIVPYFLVLLVAYKLFEHVPELSGTPILFLVASTITKPQFPVIAHAMNEMNMSSSELGQLAISCSMLTELIGLTLTGVSVIVQQASPSATYKSTAFFFIFILFTLYFVRPIIVYIINITPEGKPVKRIYVVGILLFSLVMSVLSNLLTESTVLGVVLVGLAIPDGPPLGSTIIEKSELMIMELFLPLFFVRVGYMTDIYSIKDWMAFATMQSIIFTGYVGSIIGCCLASLIFKITLRNAFVLGNILNIRGLIELMNFVTWRNGKFIDDPSYASLVVSNLMMTSFVTFMIHIIYDPKSRLKIPASVKEQMRSLQSTPAIGELRMLSCIHTEDNVHGIINLLQAFNPTEESPVCVNVIHAVELSGRVAPILAPYKNQTKKFKANTTDYIMGAFMNFSESLNGSVTILPFKMIAPYKTMHESISTLAEDQFTSLIIVPFHRSHEAHDTNADIRTFNTNLHAYSPCTVGIFVDSGLRFNQKLTHFSYSVAVIFLGGSDDREALALATRMSRHHNVSITVLRVYVNRYQKEESDFEKLLDDLFFREFKTMNMTNPCVECHEEVADDTVDVIDAVRALGKNCDLIILGSRRGTKSELEQELVQWTQYPELGVIGDVIASPDFFGAMMVSVLVMRHYGDGKVDIDAIRVLDDKIDSQLRKEGY